MDSVAIAAVLLFLCWMMPSILAGIALIIETYNQRREEPLKSQEKQ